MVYVTKSDGRSMTAVTLNNIPLPYATNDDFRLAGRNSFTLDVDGDGQFDIVQVDSPNHFVMRRQTTAAPDLLRTVTDGLGKGGGVEYGPILGQPDHYRCSEGIRCDVRPQWVVLREHIDDGVSATLPVLTHHYADARINKRNGQALGFAMHEVRDQRDGVLRVTRYRFDQQTVADGLEAPFLDTPIEVTRYLPLSGDRWHATQTVNEMRTLPATPVAGATYFTYRKRTELLRYEGPLRSFEQVRPLTDAAPSTIVARHEVRVDPDPLTGLDAIDAMGNVQRETSDPGNGTSTSAVYSYRNDLGVWLIGLLERAVVTSTAPKLSGTVRSHTPARPSGLRWCGSIERDHPRA